MKDGLAETGIISESELSGAPRLPSLARMGRGKVAVIECLQEIPCNPCETVCPSRAITIGRPITNLPQLDEELCNGCGICVSACPGQAIFLVDGRAVDGKVLITLPYEYSPLSQVGEEVIALDRAGAPVDNARVARISRPKGYDRTPLLTISVAEGLEHKVRGVRRISNE